MGRNNVGGGNPDSWIETDPLFEIGNSTNEKTPRNALTILKNGNTTVNGSLTAEGNITATGNTTVGGSLTAAGNISTTGKVKVNGNKGIVRSSTGDQLKSSVVAVVVNASIS